MNILQENKMNFKQIIKEKLGERIKKDDEFAQHLYASMCNVIWHNPGTNDTYSCSWRYAGGVVAKIRDKGEDYLDFYCSGGEGRVTEDVKECLQQLGYAPYDYDEYDRFYGENK